MWHPLEIPRSKTKTHGNSIQFFIAQPWKFHFLFDWPMEYPHALSSIHLETRLFHFLSVQGYGCKDPVGPLIMIFPGISISKYIFPGVKFAQLPFSGWEAEDFFRYHFFPRYKIDKDSIPGDLWVKQSFFPDVLIFENLVISTPVWIKNAIAHSMSSTLPPLPLPESWKAMWKTKSQLANGP